METQQQHMKSYCCPSFTISTTSLFCRASKDTQREVIVVAVVALVAGGRVSVVVAVAVVVAVITFYTLLQLQFTVLSMTDPS